MVLFDSQCILLRSHLLETQRSRFRSAVLHVVRACTVAGLCDFGSRGTAADLSELGAQKILRCLFTNVFIFAARSCRTQLLPARGGFGLS